MFFSTRSGFDIGCLFHAKEHPAEFTNRIGLFPVCSAEAGGQSDPRRGTLLSIKDSNFKDRNFLWLQTLNATFRFDLDSLDSSELLAPGASGSRFFTVDESNFGTQLGTICYLPKAHDPAVPYQRKLEELENENVLCVPCHGFPADWHLARALASTTEEAAIQSVHLDVEVLALLAAQDHRKIRKRVQRLGSPSRRGRLLTFAEKESLGGTGVATVTDGNM